MKEKNYTTPLEKMSDAIIMQDETPIRVCNPVTISAREYRELITDAVGNRKDAERYSAEVWELGQKLKNAEAKITEVETENKKLINELAKLEIELANYKEVCKNVRS